MTTAQDLEQTLVKLVEATKEAKAVTANMHAATRDLKVAQKEAKAQLPGMLQTLLEAEMERLSSEVTIQMRAMMEEVMQRILQDWRAKLGL